MGKFVTKFVIFLIPLIIVAIAIETAVRHVPNSYSYKDMFIRENGNEIETLILGSSNMYAGICPESIPKSFNLANSSQRLEFDYYLLSHYVDDCHHLKEVILGVDCMNLFIPNYESGSSDWNRLIYYTIYMNYPKYSIFSKYSYELTCSKSMIRKLDAILKRISKGKYDSQCDRLGMGLSYNINDKDDSAMSERYAQHLLSSLSSEDSVEKYNLNYLYKIAALCYERDLKLVLVTTPHSKAFIKTINPRFLQKFGNDIALFLDRNPNVSYYNYIDSIERENDFFYNVNHLSNLGAKYFTEQLYSDIKKAKSHNKYEL